MYIVSKIRQTNKIDSKVIAFSDACTHCLLCLSTPSLGRSKAEGHNGKNTYFLGLKRTFCEL